LNETADGQSGKNVLLYIILIFLIGSAEPVFTTSFHYRDDHRMEYVFYIPVVQHYLFTLIVVSTMTMVRYFRALNFYKSDAIKVGETVHRIPPSSRRDHHPPSIGKQKKKISYCH